jgi:hypothetical protein
MVVLLDRRQQALSGLWKPSRWRFLVKDSETEISRCRFAIVSAFSADLLGFSFSVAFSAGFLSVAIFGSVSNWFWLADRFDRGDEGGVEFAGAQVRDQLGRRGLGEGRGRVGVQAREQGRADAVRNSSDANLHRCVPRP